MTYRVEVVKLDRENRPNDLVKLLGGQRNCFHIRKNPDGVLKKLQPMLAVIIDENNDVIGTAPENVVRELHAGRIDVNDMVEVKLEYRDMWGIWYAYEPYMGQYYPEFYLGRTRIKFNEDGSVACEVIIPKLHHRPNRTES
jgi:hypothetical protein